MELAATVHEHARHIDVDDLISVSEAARLLGCSESLVRILADRGEIPTIRINRHRLFLRANVDQVRAQRAQLVAQR